MIKKKNSSKGWTLIRNVMWVFLGFIIVSLIGMIVWAKLSTTEDPKEYAKFWPKNLSYEKADSIALKLTSQMDLDEKINQMTGDLSKLEMVRFAINFKLLNRMEIVLAGENRRLKIPPIAFTDGPKGVVVAAGTTFPVAIARGATWDAPLALKVGEVMGSEARAAGANYSGAVCINVLRHPAWGRAQETFGEDPWLIGELGLQEAIGIQKQNVMACVKHFAANSIEISRFKVNVEMNERTLHEVYLPHFKKLVQEGNVASIMSSYNKINGYYAAENKHLLDEILRKQWNFKGIVSSDWVYGVYNGAKSVNAGLDIEMPISSHYTRSELKPALETGTINIKQIDEIVRRIVRTKLMYVSATDKSAYPKTLLASKSHQDLALKVAEKSMVLLKNNSNVLPLDLGKIKTLAVIGKLAENDNIGDNGSSRTVPPHVIQILQGIKQHVGNRIKVVFNDGKNIEDVKKVAKTADAVIFVVGYNSDDEGEYLSDTGRPYTGEWGKGGDRPNLALKSHDIALLNNALPLNSKSAVVLIGGSAILTNGWDQKASSILLAWYPGMMGGKALANVLFGNVNPSGKLPFVIPKEEKDLPYFYPDLNRITYGYYHGYTLMDKKNITPAYHFGFGLSYTKFSFFNLDIKFSKVKNDDTLFASIDVKNIGKLAGEEVIQVYVGFKNSKIDRPIKLLRGFKKESFAVGQKKTITIPIKIKDLSWYDSTKKEWMTEPMEYELYMGSSSSEKDLLKSSFKIFTKNGRNQISL